jgi:hypothetical protein
MPARFPAKPAARSRPGSQRPPDFLFAISQRAFVTLAQATEGSFYRPIPDDVYFGGDEVEVLLTLNWNRGVATATTPGASMASVAGREFHARAEEQAAAAQSGEAELAGAGELPGVPGQVAGE